MELVYLWVEEYKNIYHEGFNFSPRFDCEFKDEYDKNGKLRDNCELIIKKNDDFVDIFPKNINITAIVGENGSGKSNIISKILNLAYVRFFIKKDGKYYTNVHNIIIDDIIEYEFIDNPEINGYCTDTDLFLDPKIDGAMSYLRNNQKLVSSKNRHLMITNDRLYDVPRYKKEIQKLILKNFAYNDFLEYKPKFIIIKKPHNKFEILFKNKTTIDIETFVTEYSKEKEYFNKLINDDKISFDIVDETNKRIFDFSYGEKNYLINQVLLIDALFSDDKDELVILLDEPDITFHPNLQKRYFNQLITILKKTKKLCHIIITTHSPFIISDLPKENVIFLKDGKQIDALEKKQTFGANIHTLLSDGFFMDGGLMGEFAKGKIDEVIELLNSQGKLDDVELKLCKDIVSIIGEPILKKQLQRMLNNKLELSNKDEIDIIKKQMKELKSRLSEIENDSD